ncbi:hypothetical protein DYB37_006700 [Aphanomyces astaci]|uniref:Uncharacterized protein n=1 Tax=Aphanomyces astaci TaxID=112090 RepID=A0A397FHK4_APHAT|nr:hypothetical protein DYB30_002301 [Aphanomyces astaci]RHY86616.1 hypothetical protein DYB35_010169 [Aphanomyces astaci]RHZ26739.1 hypothetical protein DYB31_009747 [Aphanomyces astaci]RHZ27077.1 hypothetical protein DYB37_006700 [Aphanomyces astaci]RHZ27130.1 hypothetical protein DYB26_000992 [Aphanomyces astaci]
MPAFASIRKLVHRSSHHASSNRLECPFANVDLAISAVDTSQFAHTCPFHAHAAAPVASITSPVDLVVRSGTFVTSSTSATLLQDIGGGDKIRECCTRFYAHAFLDSQLKPFFFEDDGATAHGQRLADWIIEKMGGQGTPWSDSGRRGMRQPSHYKAWNNAKRHDNVRGNHFNLVDTRTWMRIHFWAARECGLHLHEAFWVWYVRFLGHFIAVYEQRAVPYANEDAKWSKLQTNIDAYIRNDHTMPDLLE